MDSAEIYFAYNNQKQVLLDGTSIGTQRAKEELGVGIRIIHKGSEGFSSTNIITEEAIKKASDEAFVVAKLSPKIEGLGLAKKQPIKSLDGAYNEELANLDVDEIISDGLDFIKGFSSIDSRIKTTLSSLTLNTSGVAILNSNGVKAERKSVNYQSGLIAIASDKEKSGAFTFETTFSREHNVNFFEVGETLGKRAVDGLNQEPLKEFEGPVIFQKNAMFNPVGLVALLTVSADWRQRGTSFWKDRLADKVADERISIVDKPFDLSGGGGVKPFDEEGNPTKEIEIIKDGILQTFLHNQLTANKENLPPTGNASRAFGQQPSFTQRPNNIFPNSPWILAGDMSEEEMIKDTKKGLIVNSYTGTVRFQNGIFSGVAKGTYLIEDGEIIKPVTGVSISGNSFDLLNNVVGIGKEYHLVGGILTTPIMKFEGIKVSTK